MKIASSSRQMCFKKSFSPSHSNRFVKVFGAGGKERENSLRDGKSSDLRTRCLNSAGGGILQYAVWSIIDANDLLNEFSEELRQGMRVTHRWPWNSEK